MNLKIPNMSVWEYLLECNQNNRCAVAINYYGKRLTFDQLFRQIDKAAKAFQVIGIKRGSKVTVCMPNTPEGIISFYALNKLGAVANMIHPLSSENEMRDYVNEVDSHVMVMIDLCLDKAVKQISKTKLEKVIVVSPKNSMNMRMQIGYYLINHRKIPRMPKKDNRFVQWNDFVKLGSLSGSIKKSEFEQNQPAAFLHSGGTTGIQKVSCCLMRISTRWQSN